MDNYAQDTQQHGTDSHSDQPESLKGNGVNGSIPNFDSSEPVDSSRGKGRNGPIPNFHSSDPMAGNSICRIAQPDPREPDEIAAALEEGLLDRANRAELPFGSAEFFNEAEIPEGLLPRAARTAF